MDIKTTSLDGARRQSLTDLIELEGDEQLTLEEHRLKAELLAAVALDQDDPATVMAVAHIARLHAALASPLAMPVPS
ncbi:hypothetical protein BJF79_09580 [Actinomadura sp. CNU-125]|nr:hypothetical protein [Actinomadura sp. CNU-125]OLT30489.1 hypothetical protein BJF79_09580 [Actinomadura sp. CNU-125]